MDAKDTGGTTLPSVALTKPAPKHKTAGEPHLEDPVPSVPLCGPKDDSLDLSGLGAAFSGLRVWSPVGKEKEKEKETRKGGARENREGQHERTEDAPFRETPSESTPGAAEHPDRPSTSSPTTNTPRATHPATLSPTTTPPVAKGIGLTGVPYPTYGVDPLATARSMAHPVSEPVASRSCHTGVSES